MIQNQVDLDLAKNKVEEEPISTVLSPNLGPRSPTIEKPDGGANATRSSLTKRSKSEVNISKLSSYSLSPADSKDHYPSPRNTSRGQDGTGSHTDGAWTSTPKYATLGTKRSPHDRRLGPASLATQRQQQAFDQRPASAQQQSRHLPQTPKLNAHRAINGSSDSDASPYLRSRSAVGFGSHDDARSGVVENGENPDMRRQNSGSSVGSGSIGSYNARQGVSGAFSPPVNSNTVNNNINSSAPPQHGLAQQHANNMRLNLPAGAHQRYPSTDSSGDRVNDRAGNYQPQASRTPQTTRHHGPMKASYIPPEHQAAHPHGGSHGSGQAPSGGGAAGGQDQYTPGNMRHMVQNYQKNVQQQQQHQSPSQHGARVQSPQSLQHGARVQSPQSSQKSFNTSHSSNQSLASSSQPNTVQSPSAVTSSPYQQHQQQNASTTSARGVYSPQRGAVNQASPMQLTQPQKYNPAAKGYKSPPAPKTSLSNHGRPDHSDPVAPPRRARPVSAGPLKSSVSSAFSAPQNRSRSPPSSSSSSAASAFSRSHSQHSGVASYDHHQQRVDFKSQSSSGHHSGTGTKAPPRDYSDNLQYGSSAHSLSLQRRPEDSRQAYASPTSAPSGSAPPAAMTSSPREPVTDQQVPPGGKKPVWYEYGCV